MNGDFDSVYPDFLKTGLGKLNQLDARRELLALFSAVEHFRRDLHGQESALGILEVTQRYITGLNLFHAAGFWLVNSTDFSFELTLAEPTTDQALLQGIIDRSIKSGRFAYALRQNSPLFLHAGNPEDVVPGLLHSLAISSQAVGMFCGLLHREMAPTQEVAFSLLSLLLGGSADALATLRKTKQLTSEVETLTALLPLCAWCKKFRNDGGYWEQIEKYIGSHSHASITHGICPDCQKNFLNGLGVVQPGRA
jgi:hypothetical protein